MQRTIRLACASACVLALAPLTVEAQGRGALFVGAASDLEEEETGFALGAEYMREVLPNIEAGPIVETAFFENATSYLLLVAGRVSPASRLELTLGPGLEILNPEGEARETEVGAALRMGAGYALPIPGRFSVTPEINLDFANDATTLVYGVSAGMEF
jgi:hypothetical protein